MRLFQWSSAYEVFVPEIDAEHQAIFRIGGNLYRAVNAATDARRAQPQARELALHVGEHFSREERRMRTARCPYYAWHKRQHDTARSKVKDLERRVKAGDRDAVLGSLQFLSEWLKTHLCLHDRMMAASLRSHRRMVA